VTGRTGQRNKGLEERIRPSPRSAVLAAASRALVVLLVLIAGGFASSPFWQERNEIPTMNAMSWEPAAPPRDISVGGVTIARLISSVTREVRGVRAQVVELEIAPLEDVRAEIRLRIDLPDGGAGSIAHVLAALSRANLEEPQVRAVTTAPAGARIDVVAVVSRATAPLVASVDGRSMDPTRDVSVELTDLMLRSDVELRRLEVRDGGQPDGSAIVRLVVRSQAADLIRLVEELEQEHTAPMRITSLRMEATGEAFQLSKSFEPRTVPYGVPVSTGTR
jgi:hypothetical protein